MENIIKTTIFLRHLEDYGTMRQAEREYWQRYAPGLLEEPPASTFMQPASLSQPNMLVEIDAIAMIP
jgi:enamine deaminase RidA (YjgF/YER057c/UK114 family)